MKKKIQRYFYLAHALQGLGSSSLNGIQIALKIFQRLKAEASIRPTNYNFENDYLRLGNNVQRPQRFILCLGRTSGSTLGTKGTS